MTAGVVQVGRVAMARCACGGAIVVYQAGAKAVGDAVHNHQRTLQHRSWWSRVRDDWQGRDG